jgi:hypothetical protein
MRWTDPRTWPWFFYIWLLIILAGYAKPVWRWLQRKRAQDWPATEGLIESAGVKKTAGFWKRSNQYVAELGYSYSVAGQRYGQLFKRDFPTEREAQEFLRDLTNKLTLARPEIALSENTVRDLGTEVRFLIVTFPAQSHIPTIPFSDGNPLDLEWSHRQDRANERAEPRSIHLGCIRLRFCPKDTQLRLGIFGEPGPDRPPTFQRYW